MRLRWLFLISVLLGGCDAFNRKPVDIAIDATEATDVLPAAQLGFRRVAIRDSFVNLDAITCLVPEGWQVNTRTDWVRTDFIEPFKYTLVAADTADSINQIEVFPTLSYFTSSEQSAPVATGSKKTELIHSPQLANTAIDAIKDFLIPAFRPDIRDLRVKEFFPLNSIDGTDNDGKPLSKETGVVRVQYDVNGEMVEEIFFATLAKRFIPLDKYDTQCRWHIEGAVSCRAHAGDLDDQLKNLQTLVGNMHYEFKWLLKYDRALQAIEQQRDDTLSTKALTHALSQKDDGALDASGVFQQYQRRLSRRAQVYNRYQSLLQTYVDNSGGFVQLPMGFAVAWKSDDNRYLLTDSISYKPQLDVVAWYELKKNESRQELDVYYTTGGDDEALDEALNK